METMEFRIRPRGEFIQESDWIKLHALTSHWISDIKFYKDELRFLKKLINQYLIWIEEDDHLRKMENIQNEIQLLTSSVNDLLNRTKEHQKHIETLIDAPVIHNTQEFRKDHQILEDAIADFIKSYRKQRKAIFTVVEYIFEYDRLGKKND